ncbi:MAG: efflux transporter outer membrane subunit [Syntrophobacter sp.]
MIKKKLVVLALMAVFLSGCTMIPKYSRPQAPVPPGWPSGDAYKESAAQGGPVAAALQWRQYFSDERLQTIIETALKNNRDLRVAALNVEKARALYQVQRAEVLPTVSGSVSQSMQRTTAELSDTGRAHNSEQYNANLGISSWEIDFFGRIRSLTKSSLEQYFATEQARRSAQILLVAEVASAYLTLAADRENLQLSQSTLEAQMASAKVIGRRHEVGLVPELDLRQVQTRVESARVDVARYTQQVAQDENALNLLVGAPVPANLLPESLTSVAALPDVSPGTSSEVLLTRPDILQAENLLRSANADIGAARAAFFPRISLTTAMGSASGDLLGLFKAGSMTWNYAPQIVMPIFDARLWSALKATQVQREITVAQYEKAIQSAFREVADALAQKGTIGDQIEAQKALVFASGEAYRLSNMRYERGTDTYLNVLDAQRSLYSAQQGLITISLSRYASQVRLYQVLGGGTI